MIYGCFPRQIDRRGSEVANSFLTAKPGFRSPGNTASPHSTNQMCRELGSIHLLVDILEVALVMEERLGPQDGWGLLPATTLVRGRQLPPVEPDALRVVVQDRLRGGWSARLRQDPVLDYLWLEYVAPVRTDELPHAVRAHGEARRVLLKRINPLLLNLASYRVQNALLPHHPRHVNHEVRIGVHHLLNHVSVTGLVGTAAGASVAPHKLQVWEGCEHLLHFP
mmetsp:Transcript_2239/g.4357  ORF Transcript_2239/g.4357 Transcript_2239/m.4357 type:complete len:223 (+) Transcript_2239:208-876(+)